MLKLVYPERDGFKINYENLKLQFWLATKLLVLFLLFSNQTFEIKLWTKTSLCIFAKRHETIIFVLKSFGWKKF